MKSVLYSCPIVMKLELFHQMFDKSSNIKFHGNPSCGSEFHANGRTDDYSGEAGSRFTQFCERA